MAIKKIKIKVIAGAKFNKVGEIFIDENNESWLKLYVTSIAENNKANQSSIKLLAKYLQIPKSMIKIVQGKINNHKIIEYETRDS